MPVSQDLAQGKSNEFVSIADRFRKSFTVDDDKLRLLSHSKRFLERWTADASFRQPVLDETMSLEEAGALCGCEIDVHSLLPVFHTDYTIYRATATMEDWPLTYMWDDHLRELLRTRDMIPAQGSSRGKTLQFDMWRARNMNRAALQLDVAASGITHPPVTFELSSGCSVGCWFCGISAKKFKGHASLLNGGDIEWRKTVEAVKSILGDGLENGFCYWATDPLDNPEYMDFIEIFEDITGIVPQVTTAIPLRNIELTRAVIEKWKTNRSMPNRFSVMTKRQLLEIHKTFSPEDLFGVEIVLQTGGEGAVTKFAAGKNMTNPAKKEKSLEGTIACVTGFLINILEKNVKLISPTMPSETWPDGYIIYASYEYSDADDLKRILDHIVANDMKVNMSGGKSIRIADGGTYNRDRDPEAIKFRRLQISNEFINLVGDQLSSGDNTPISITKSCLEKGMTPIAAIGSLERMWQEGLIVQEI